MEMKIYLLNIRNLQEVGDQLLLTMDIKVILDTQIEMTNSIYQMTRFIQTFNLDLGSLMDLVHAETGGLLMMSG